MDSLYIQDLELWTRIGVTDAERSAEQRVLMSVEIFCDLQPATKTDDVAKSIDYEQVTNNLKALAGSTRKTVERLAEDAAQMILKKYEPKGGVKVSIQKFVLPGTRAVHVSIFRKP